MPTLCTRTTRYVWFVLLMFLGMHVAAPVEAQDASAGAKPERTASGDPARPNDAGTAPGDNKGEARRLFLLGVSASEAGQSTEALEHFRGSYKNFAAPNTAVNIAGLHFERSEFEAAIEWAEKAKGHANIKPSSVELADSYISQANAELEKREVANADVASDKRSRSNAEAIDATLSEEQAVASEDMESDGTTALTDQWWFWTGVGVLVVGATVGIVAAASSGEEGPIGGNLMPGVVTW